MSVHPYVESLYMCHLIYNEIFQIMCDGKSLYRILDYAYLECNHNLYKKGIMINVIRYIFRKQRSQFIQTKMHCADWILRNYVIG